MANTTISPNMSLPVPTVSEAPGPGWASSLDSCLSIVDGHDHSAGSGVPVTPAGLNINVDLPFGSNNATALRSARFTSQSAAISNATDIGCLYEVGVDLYYNDGNGNQVRITQGGSVTGATGTITGLPSGTASASFSAGTFTFQSATSTPATMAVGPLVIGNAVASSKTITIAPNASIAANYNFTLPAALPATSNYVTLDNLGNVSYNSSGVTGSGAVVLATMPTIGTATFTGLTTVSSSGIAFSSGTMVNYAEGTYTPSFVNVSNFTSAAIAGTSRYQRVGNFVYVWIQVSNIVGLASNTVTFTITLPIAPANNFSDRSGVYGSLNSNNGSSATVFATSGAKTASASLSMGGGGSYGNASIVFAYLQAN